MAATADKSCTKCGNEQYPYVYKKTYGTHKAGLKEWRCRTCSNTYDKNRRASLAATNPTYWRESNLKKNYGITINDYNLMFKAQGFACKICKTDKTNGKNWHVDHDHLTNKIRGILCHSCNVLLGHAKDSLNILEAALLYLKQGEI